MDNDSIRRKHNLKSYDNHNNMNINNEFSPLPSRRRTQKLENPPLIKLINTNNNRNIKNNKKSNSLSILKIKQQMNNNKQKRRSFTKQGTKINGIMEIDLSQTQMPQINSSHSTSTTTTPPVFINNNNNNNDEMDVDTDENKENDMEVDNDGGNGDIDTDENKDEDEKAMELEIDKDKKGVDDDSDIGLEEYMNENNLKFIHLSGELLDEVDPGIIDKEIEDIRDILDRSHVNMGAIEAYRVKDTEYVDRLKDLQGCKVQRDKIREEYENYKRMRFDSFMNGFSIITKKLKEMYRMLTCGGDAELELVDSIDPFSEGVQFSVRPPKKSWKNISNLSGGEKTLSSMALVFALHHYKPTPLYVMDEIDAALDFKNVSIVANYIQKRTKNAQFVIISLRNNMFELANRLVGIYKTNNASKSITIDPKLFTLPKTQSQIQQQQQTQMQQTQMQQQQKP
eukprot:1004978_1